MSIEAEKSLSEYATEWVTHHVADGRMWTVGKIHVDFDALGLPSFITLHAIMSALAALLVVLLFCRFYDRRGLVPKGRLTHLLESIVLFVRNDIAIAYLGEKDGRRMAWLFLTQFTLILAMNILGLIPGGSTATSNLSLTAALATTTFLAMVVGGILKNGVGGFFKAFVPHGVPLPILFILVPIEFAGLFIKTIVLAIRLFANLLAGHIVLYAMLGLIVVYGLMGVPFLGLGLFVYFLEMLVAVLQAYIFTMLSAIFIGQIYHPEH